METESFHGIVCFVGEGLRRVGLVHGVLEGSEKGSFSRWFALLIDWEWGMS